MEEIRCYSLQVGDIIGGRDPQIALENMINLHEHGYETCLHSYWNGHVCTALEIISIPKEKVIMKNDSASI